MISGAERRKQTRRKSLNAQEEIKIHAETDPPDAVWRARVVDVSEWGMSVECATPFEVGSLIRVSGSIQEAAGSKPLAARYRVCWRSAANGSAYRFGLAAEAEAPTAHHVSTTQGDFVDYYEVLQLSPKADSETIHRVFRILAQRYHPDNAETGNAALFREALEAFRVLNDPERRASFDARLDANRRTTLRIFDNWQSSVGIRAEKSKRQGILAALYGKRIAEPSQPALSLREIEEVIACPREHLEFSLWYLKEQGYVTRGDNARFTITAKGVDLAERIEVASEAPAGGIHLRLPAASAAPVE